jgi:hypothetical protein
MPQWRILCVAAMLCGLGAVEMRPPTRHAAGDDTARTKPTGKAVAEPARPGLERFLVKERGYRLLGPDGEEKEILETKTNAAGGFSPDGRWVALSRDEPTPTPGQRHGCLVIQSRSNPENRTSIPLVWGTTGSSFLPLWSSDSRRILICEQGFNEGRSRASAYRVYDLGLKSLTPLRIPDEWWPSDWSVDGKRLLTSLRAENGSTRVAWVPSDGSGKPEFLTSDQDETYGARLSPDNRRILCTARPREPRDGRRARLYVIDLITKKRVVIDKPGHTHGYCWSSDGQKVAYTWQLPIREPEAKVDRKTYLITCDSDGDNQKTVTMRSYKVPPNNSGRESVIFFFEVLAWWR